MTSGHSYYPPLQRRYSSHQHIAHTQPPEKHCSCLLWKRLLCRQRGIAGWAIFIYVKNRFGVDAQYGRSLRSPSRFAHYNNSTKILGRFLTLCLPPAYPSGDTKPRLYNILIMVLSVVTPIGLGDAISISCWPPRVGIKLRPFSSASKRSTAHPQ